MIPGIEPEKPIREQINQLFDRSLDELRKLGFSPSDNGLKWLDLVFLAPELNWKDASKIILYSVRSCRELIANGEIHQDFGEVLTERTVNNLRYIFLNAAKVLKQKSNGDLTPQACNAVTLTILPDNIATNIMHLNRALDPKIMQLSLDYFESFFSVVLKIAENLPEEIQGIMAGVKKECIDKYLFDTQEFPSLKNVTNGIFHGILFSFMDHSDWANDQLAYQAICKDKKPAELYSAYKLLVKNADASEYHYGVACYQALLKLERRERSKMISILTVAGSEAATIFDFLTERPEYLAIAERVAKSNSFDQSEALKLLIEFGSSNDHPLGRLLITISDSTVKLGKVLNSEFLSALFDQAPEYIEKIQNYLVVNNDPECLQSLIDGVKRGDLLRTDLITQAQALFGKESERKKAMILKLNSLDLQSLPDTLSPEAVMHLTRQVTREISAVDQGELASTSKRSDLILLDSRLIEARQIFNKYQCGRLFREAISEYGESSDVANNICRHIKDHLTSSFYQSTLDSHRMRRIYFQHVLTNPDFLATYEQRLTEVNKLSHCKVHQEVDLFASWLEAKHGEIKQLVSLSQSGEDDLGEGKIVEFVKPLTIKCPPSFKSILIVMPLERVNPLKAELMMELAPKITDIRIADSEKFAPLKDIANNIPADRLVLYMTGSGSHSNFLSFKIALPAEHRSQKLYTFKGKRELKQLLEFFNSSL